MFYINIAKIVKKKKKKKKYDLIFKPVITKNNIFDNLLIFVFSHSKDGKV